MECRINSNAAEIEVIKVNGSESQIKKEQVVTERALTVYLNGQELVTMVYSPGYEKELVTGFLVSEGIIKRPDQLVKFSYDMQEGLAWVDTAEKSILEETLFMKRYMTSCCGKGRTSFYFANDARLAQKIDSPLQITSKDVSYYINLMEEKSELFRRTGGVHGGALASDGQLQYFAFDIGRHNVLDKLYGQVFLEGIDISRKIIVFSGRISSEILIKTAKMGCPILIGVSAPTDLALNLAKELGITVIGFARQERMNLYTHPERIIISEERSF